MAVEITVYNLSVKIETTDQTFIKHIEDFLAKYYTDFGVAFSKQQDPNKQKKVFVSKLKNYNTYYLHINQFGELREYLGRVPYNPHVTKKLDMRFRNAKDADMSLLPQWTPREEQKPVIDFVVNNYNNGVVSTLVPIQTGKGKAQPYYSAIKTPDGWTTMGEVYIGQTIVTPDGDYETVTGVYPQGYTPVYTITFEDGRSVVCSDKHLWEVISKDGKSRVIDTLDIIDRLSNEDLYIPTVHGDNSNSDKSPDTSLKIGKLISSLNPESTYELELFLNEPMDVVKIPNSFMNMDRCNTINLLSGLGLNVTSYDPSVMLEYICLNEVLIKQIKYLLWSIGYVAYIKNNSVFYQYKDKLKIISVKYKGLELTKCISITSRNNRKLYITDNFIATHNTFVSLCAVSRIKKRLGILILPMYIDQWLPNILKTHDTVAENIVLVQGRKMLLDVIEMARNNTLTQDYIIFSATTMQEYITSYEEDPDYTYEVFGMDPIELFPLLGIGVLLIDETHQHLHSVYKTMVHANATFCLALSATAISESRTIKRVYNFLYPKQYTYEGFVYDRYIDVYPTSYVIGSSNIRHIRTFENGSNFYSHNAFEKSIMKNKNNMLNNYFTLIADTTKNLYEDHYVDGDKLLIFTSTVMMATRLTEYLSKKYPGLIVNRYCEKDSFDNLINSDIIVSTPISAGTAVDIKKLRVVILTVNISSVVSNLQILGRLRKQELDVKFCYLYCVNIPKHVEYHKKKKELFLTKVSSIREQHSPIQV